MSMLFPESFDRDTLYPIAVRADALIREYNDKKIVFFEPAQIPDTIPFFGGITIPMSFPDSPGGPANKNVQVLNDHTYCCEASPEICVPGEPQLYTS